MKTLALSIALAVAFLAGCNRPSVSTLPFDQMSDSDFVAVVNGVGYSKGELERDVNIIEKLQTLGGIPPEEMNSRKDPMGFRRSVVRGFVDRELLIAEARKRHIDLLPSDMDGFQRQFADGLSGVLPLNFDALLSHLGHDATAFRNNLKKDALSAKMEEILKRRIAEALPAPTAEKLARDRQDAHAANRQIASDNKALFRLATNAWKSIRAGNDFAVVGRKLPSLNKGIAYETDCMDAAARFTDAKADLLTPPVPHDGCLEVVKISIGTDGVRHCSRLLFTPKPLRPVPSDEELTAQWKTKAIGKYFARQLKELREAAEISTF